MNRRTLFFFIIFSVIAVVIAITAFVIFRAPIVNALPSSAQIFLESGAAASGQALRETFGMSAVEDIGSGTLEDVALGDDDSSSSPAPASISTAPSPTEGAAISDEPIAMSSLPVSTAEMEQESAPAEMQTTAIATPSPSSAACSFPSPSPATSSLSQKITLNEIAWMGMPSAGDQEWIELKNNSARDTSLSGWTVMNASGKMKVNFGTDDRITAGGFLLLLRGSTTLPYAHASERSYSGDLRNAGDDLVLLDPACGVSDFVGALANGWPAGNNTTKQTMERDDDTDANGVGWHTSVSAGGTPGAENSVVLPPAQYKVTVMFEGESGDTIIGNPSGMTCVATQCTGTFAEKTKLALTEQPATGAIFDGWSGACAGKGKCSFTVTGDTTITALFHMPVVATADSESDTDTNSDSQTVPASEPASTSSTPVASGHILIAAVQIAGAASANDFVKLYNPSSAAVDVGGWKLRKRSQSGAEYSLRTIPADTAIGPGKYFVWANSADGFSSSIGADISSTETLAGNNSVALIDVGGNIEDALAWGTGTNQYGEGLPYSDNPAAGQVLTRKMANGAPADTGNNADDFVLQ